MQLQIVDGLPVYVVDLTAGLPELPIHSDDMPAFAPYAEALTSALTDGIITKPGKYGIYIKYTWRGVAQDYAIFAIIE